ncbi:MAG: hypothetical protein A2551_00225 [Elusimicrobia bacterium RIFOXYD2_FULL_34_30]|nr:MAG: hypothetical protein A2551_00225 [Elusimicrobia bacterium RIFOXYD2_FULL_34_30]
MKLKCGKKYLIFLISLLFYFNSNSIFASTQTKTIRVIKNGKSLSSITLHLINGMGYLSADDIASIYNAKINWYSASKKVILSINGKEVIFRLNSKNVIINNAVRSLNKPTILEKGKLFIPLEFLLTKSFSDISNFDNDWDYRQLVFKIDSPNDVSPVRFYSYKDKTRLVVQALNKKEIHIDAPAENKIVVKVYKSKIDAEKSTIKINDGVIDNINAKNLERDVLFSINLGTYSGKYETTTLSSPFRLVLDIERNIVNSSETPKGLLDFAPSATGFVEPKVVIAPQVTKKKKQTTELYTERKEKKIQFGVKKIVVDAGHGGEDPGAIGCKGTKEKDINLEIAKKLAKLLKENDYKVYTTRSEDVFVPLEDRTRFANKVGADLFISIHCNASLQNNTRGFEIYFLSENATDKAAEAVANLENSVIALEDHSNGVKKGIEKLLLSMAVNEFINESSFLCGVINHEVCSNVTNFSNRGVKQANFYVLRGATMPSILIELAFLSNLNDERLLNQKKFHKKIVKSIFDGIKAYEKRITK